MPESPALFVFDVDGTLLDSNLRIRPSTRSSVQQVLRAGHHVALASARPPRSVAELSEELLGDVTEIISLNGAYVTHGREVLLEHAIRPEDVRTLIGEARRRELEINVLTEWEWLVERDGPGVAAEVRIVRFEPTRVRDLMADLHRSVHKILLIGPHEQVAGLRDWAVRQKLQVEPTLSKATYCEVVAQGTSKAGAVAFLAHKLGVPTERVIAFGDGENDLPMLLEAGVSVAMGNAMDVVKRAAHLVTDSHDEDGIARALRQLGYTREATN